MDPKAVTSYGSWSLWGPQHLDGFSEYCFEDLPKKVHPSNSKAAYPTLKSKRDKLSYTHNHNKINSGIQVQSLSSTERAQI